MFKRINAYGKTLGVEIEHYIISSGIAEIVQGTPIAKEFKRIYGRREIEASEYIQLFQGVLP